MRIRRNVESARKTLGKLEKFEQAKADKPIVDEKNEERRCAQATEVHTRRQKLVRKLAMESG